MSSYCLSLISLLATVILAVCCVVLISWCVARGKGGVVPSSAVRTTHSISVSCRKFVVSWLKTGIIRLMAL